MKREYISPRTMVVDVCVNHMLCLSMTENTGGLGHESTDNRDKFRNRERDCR